MCCVILVTSTLFVVSCSDSDLIMDEYHSQDAELNNFFASSEYDKLKENLSHITRCLAVEQSTMENYPKQLKIYTIPVVENGHLKGKLHVFSKNEGTVYRTIYEDWNDFSEEKGGDVKMYSSNNNYIATFNYQRTSVNKYSVRITDVVEVNEKIITKRVATRSEFPTNPDDMNWIDCVADCYSYTKDACANESQCNLLCDLVDLVSGCTVSVAAACGIYCI